MHSTTVRVADRTWRDVQVAAREDGVRTTRWAADAIVERLATRARRGDVDELRRQVAELTTEVRELRARLAAVERAQARRRP